MDISQLTGLNHVANDAAIRNQKKEKIEKSKKNLFSRELSRAKESVSSSAVLSGDEEFTELMDSLFNHGEILVKDPTMNNLRTYRNSVSLFFKFVIKQSIDFDTYQTGTGRVNPLKPKKQKIYYLISVTDKKIDDIAKNVLGDQRKQFDLLGAVEEINGLIVDLIS